MNMTIGKKLFTALAAMLAITLLMGTVAIRNVGTLGTSIQELGHHSATLLYLAGNTNALTADILANTRGVMVRGFLKDPEMIRKYNANCLDDLSKLKQQTQQIVQDTRSPQLRDMAQNELIDKLDPLAQMIATLTDLSLKGDMVSASTLYKDKLNPLGTAVSDSGDRVSTLQRQIVAARADSASTLVAPARYFGIAMIVLAFVVGGGVIWLVRGINATLSENIAELRDGADQVANAASQVSSSSQSLAQGASEQAASLEETSASSEEINSMARKNTDNSRSTAQLLTQSQQKVTLANQYLSEMELSMSQITDSSGKIAKIIKVIDEIAFQTNILALNAAVEAARAGEAGMGFAVVADEVRSLAQRSAQAAKDTAVLIEDSIARSSEGKSKVDQVAVAIRAVTEDSARVKVMVDEVSLGSEEQSRGIDQIGKAIAQMEQVTQTSAATAEESAAAAEELNAQSETMKDIVGRLQAMVDGGNGTGAEAGYRSMHRVAPPRATPALSRPKAAAASYAHSGTAHRAPLRPALFNTQVPAALLDASKQGQPRGNEFPMEDSFQSF